MPELNPAAHERGRRCSAGFIPDFGKIVAHDAVQHVPPLHGGRAPDPLHRRAGRDRARRRREDASAVAFADAGPEEEPRARSTSPCCCTTSPRAGRRIIPMAGARIARRICPRLGLSPAETETVAWLVEHHLRDVDDGADRATSTTARRSRISPRSCSRSSG